MDKFEYTPPKNAPVSTEALINDLKSVAKKFHTTKISQSVYSENGKYSTGVIKNRFGTWNNALKEAGLDIVKIYSYTLEQLFDNILNVWQLKGKQPRQGDMDNPKLSAISSGVYKKQFKSWTSSIKEFIDYANSNEMTAVNTPIIIDGVKRKTSRDPSLRLRYRVLVRDNFSCVKCGRSPAKDVSVTLQIDHKKAWSNGGETEFSNLQTFCEICNSGKSNS